MNRKKHTNVCGRNSSGRITIFHRGGGSKRLLRFIDLKRSGGAGIVQSVDYDPNRSARIALVKWSNCVDHSDIDVGCGSHTHIAKFSYILAWDHLRVDDLCVNASELTHTSRKAQLCVTGNCLMLRSIPLGTQLNTIEARPRSPKGGQFVRSAGTFAQLIQKSDKRCVVRLPSGILKELDSECRATIGVVSNSLHNTHKLRKAGQSRWLGRRPTVRGVAMNPVDHPHGGGEGRSGCGGKPSVSPWGKLTKGGFKTVLRKCRDRGHKNVSKYVLK